MKFPQTAKPVICRVLSGISVKICPAAILKLFSGSSPKYFNEGCNIVHWCTKIFCLVLSAFRNISDIIDIMIQKYSFFVPSVLFRQILFLSYYIFLIKKQRNRRLCMKFLQPPMVALATCRGTSIPELPISKSTSSFAVAPLFLKNISTPRSGSTKWWT